MECTNSCKWQGDIRNSSKGEIYNIFLPEFVSENYSNLLPKKIRKIFIKFRTSSHRGVSTPKHEKTCDLRVSKNCQAGGDECMFFENIYLKL